MAVGTYALTTLAKLKTFLGIPGTTNDTLLEDCVDRTTALFEHETRRNLMARDYSYDSDSEDYDPDNANLDGSGVDHLVLPQYPVNSVTTIRINETAIDERSTVLATGWVLNKKAGVLWMIGYIYTRGIKNIEIAYNAGFATAPEDLESACIEQAAWAFKQSTPGGALLGQASKSLADGSVQFTTRDLLPRVRRVLDNYKKRFAV